MRERYVEAALVEGVRALGGQTVKVAPTTRGVPDRLVLLPGGVLVLVELKAPTGRLSPAQRVWHDRAGRIGHQVVVLRSVEDVEDWLRAAHRLAGLCECSGRGTGAGAPCPVHGATRCAACDRIRCAPDCRARSARELLPGTP